MYAASLFTELALWKPFYKMLIYYEDKFIDKCFHHDIAVPTKESKSCNDNCI